ncbi:MAG: hypothetical protein V7607_5449 [Solirubrobacteraceae bacterium]
MTSSPWPVAAILDCDGLLVDTAHCWHAAYREVAAEAGRSVQGLNVAALNGASVTDAAQRLGEAIGAIVAPARLREALQAAVDHQPVVSLPGAERVLLALSTRLQLAVASNAPAAVVRTALRGAGLEHFFSVVVSAEETGTPKPAPGVYLEACRRLGVDPSDAVAFEDSTVGAAAARAAALVVVAVPSIAGSAIDADLTVGRLDDPRVFALLGVDAPTKRHSSPTAPAATKLAHAGEHTPRLRQTRA